MPKKKKKEGHGLGLTLLAATAGAIGAYFLYGTDEGKKKRKSVRGWALKAKGDVLHKVENMKEISKETYDKTVAAVLAKYEKMPDVDKAEITALGRDLASAWGHIEKGAKRVATRKKTGTKTKKKSTKK